MIIDESKILADLCDWIRNIYAYWNIQNFLDIETKSAAIKDLKLELLQIK